MGSKADGAASTRLGPKEQQPFSLFPLLSGWGPDLLPPLLVAFRAAVTSGTLGKGPVDPEEGVAQREVGLPPSRLPSPGPEFGQDGVLEKNGLSGGQGSWPCCRLAAGFQASDLTFESLGFLNWEIGIGMAVLQGHSKDQSSE